ncbi:MAG: YfiR family protein [Gammaproteobacteria bacterium]|nr:YfiR family protein [Gammaproteobacteria bacterium]
MIILLLLAAAVIFVPVFKLSAATPTQEQVVKAALIYKMANYVIWKEKPQQLTYCFIGESSHPIGDILKKKQKLGKLPPNIDVVNKDSLNEDTGKNCSVIYITNEFRVSSETLDSMSKSVFTITNSKAALNKGFIASIEIHKNKPLLSISKKNLKRSDISVNSRFLSWVKLH